jgi:hypothetical protein
VYPLADVMTTSRFIALTMLDYYQFNVGAEVIIIAVVVGLSSTGGNAVVIPPPACAPTS